MKPSLQTIYYLKLKNKIKKSYRKELGNKKNNNRNILTKNNPPTEDFKEKEYDDEIDELQKNIKYIKTWRTYLRRRTFKLYRKQR